MITQEERRMILVRRLRAIAKQHGIVLDRRRMLVLSTACNRTIGEDGITDVDMWTLIRLTQRGLFDDNNTEEKETTK